MDSTNPIYIYASLALGLLILITGQMPKVAKNWTEFLAERRRSAVDKDDADITDLKRQVKNLADRLEAREAKDEQHSEWDRKAYRALMELGQDIGPPPSLF